MRRDMSKVIVEKPRYIGRGRLKTRRIRKLNNEYLSEDETYEGAPILEGSSLRESLKAGTARSKHFSDHLNPLRKFLEARVGQKWDSVYSEMSAELRGRSTTLDHLRQHIFDLVSITVFYDDDGKPVDGANRRGWKRNLYNGNLYVDQQGYLRRVSGRPRPSNQVIEKTDKRKSVLQRFANEISRALADAQRVEEGKPPLNNADNYSIAYVTSKGRLWRVLGDGRVYLPQRQA